MATKEQIDRWRSLTHKTSKKTDVITGKEVDVPEDSDLVKAYNEEMQNYYEACLLFQLKRISALAGQDQQAVHEFSLLGPLLQMKVRAARNDWVTNGHKDDYERLSAAIEGVEGRSFP